LQVIAESIKEDSLNSRETLFQWKYRRPIFLAVTLAMFNQLTGINAITYYLNDIFGYAGFNKMSGGLQAVAFGGMNLTATFVGMALIDGLGRKTLLLIGSVGSGLALVGVSVVFALRSHREWLLQRNLGVSERNFSHAGTRQGAGAGQHDALANERAHFLFVPCHCTVVGRGAVCILCVHDGGSVRGGDVALSGDKERIARTDAAYDGD
jgi:hypothetical protein